MSASPLSSVKLTSRLVAYELKVTKRPSPEMVGRKLARLPSCPELLRLTNVVLCVDRSCTKTSSHGLGSSPGAPHTLVSLATRLLAVDENATKRPSPEITGFW